MKLIDRAYVDSHREEIITAIRAGAIFIYPTDTIYGLGVNALLDEKVEKIREIKQRDQRPISIIAPSKEWIIENCEVEIENLDKYLPGPYTLFLRRKTQAAPKLNPVDDTLGLRIPKHWFSNVVAEAGVPFVTTSVNLSGQNHMEKLEDLDEAILSQVDYVVYEGEKKGEGSKKVNLL